MKLYVTTEKPSGLKEFVVPDELSQTISDVELAAVAFFPNIKGSRKPDTGWEVLGLDELGNVIVAHSMTGGEYICVKVSQDEKRDKDESYRFEEQFGQKYSCYIRNGQGFITNQKLPLVIS